jgi:YfiR/HmsC-like
MTSGNLAIRLLAVAMLIPHSGRPEDSSQAPSEYQVKAAFLFNFAKFVEWPEPQRGPFGICILGKDPFGEALERVMKGKAVNGRPIFLRRTSDIAAARSCQIVFVSLQEVGRMVAIVKVLSDASVLSVSEIPRFCRSGGVITFAMEGQRVRFQINAGAAVRANLKISSKLLQLAVAAPDDQENR